MNSEFADYFLETWIIPNVPKFGTWEKLDFIWQSKSFCEFADLFSGNHGHPNVLCSISTKGTSVETHKKVYV